MERRGRKTQNGETQPARLAGEKWQFWGTVVSGISSKMRKRTVEQPLCVTDFLHPMASTEGFTLLTHFNFPMTLLRGMLLAFSFTDVETGALIVGNHTAQR